MPRFAPPLLAGRLPLLAALALAFLSPAPCRAEVPANVLRVIAVASASAPHVTLHWQLPAASSGSLQIYRREKGSGVWSAAIAVPPLSTSWADADAQPGVAYEYALQDSSVPPARGAIVAGCNIPLVEQRGKVLLYVDQTQAAPLAPELARLQQDLAADGWTVYRHDGPREAYPASSTNPAHHAGHLAEREAMRATIKSHHDAAPGDDWALLILGRAPIAYSGNQAPDGHTDHRGAWPTDTYYADIAGVWTDSSVNTTSAADPRNRNVPGDGKFDQNTHPAALVFQAGRIDLSQMDAVPSGLGETALLRQYLVRNHRFRRGLGPYGNVARRALIDNGFASLNATSPAWRYATALFGNCEGRVDELDWFATLQTTPVLFAYAEGGGTWTSAGGIGSSSDFATKDSLAVFAAFYGSYFGDWDVPSNFLRAPLAGTPASLGLANIWNPDAHFQHMALGETIGYSVRFTQNNTETRGGWLNGGRPTTRNLMGDPTLRLHTVSPPAHVTARSLPAGVVLSWDASPDTAISGYHVYRSASPAGPFVRLTGVAASGDDPLGSPVDATTWTDATAVSGENYTWLVKAVKLESSASGTYANQSLGEAVALAHLPAGGAPPAAPTGLAVAATGTSLRELFWRDNATDETGYQVGRLDLATGVWSPVASLPADADSFLDSGAPAGLLSHYRVRATGPAGDSAWSDPATDYARPGTAEPPVHLAVSRAGGQALVPVSRLHGDVGEVAFSWQTAPAPGIFAAAPGTDYAHAAGTHVWPHAGTAPALLSIPLPAAPSQRLSTFLRLDYSAPTNGLALGSASSSWVQLYDPAAQILPGWSTRIVAPASEPVPWPGYAEYHDGAFGLAARTGNVGTGGISDSLRFVYLPVAGDCTLTVRLVAIATELNSGPRTGIMIRASLDAGSMFKGIHVAGTGSVLEARRTSAGGSIQSASITGQSLPQWLRLSRTGNVLRAWRSADGASWSPLGADTTLSLPATAYVGMFVASNTQDDGLPAYVRFDNVDLQAALTAPAGFAAASGPLAGRISLTWNTVPGAQTYELQRSAQPGAGFATIATLSAHSVSHADEGLAPGVPCYYRIRAIIGTTLSDWSATAVSLPYLPADIEGWRYLSFGPGFPREMAGDFADPDGDGLHNLLEYAAGASPLDADASGFAPVPALRPVDGEDYLTLAFARDPAARGLKFSVEAAGDLAGDWETIDPLVPANQFSVEPDAPLPGLQRIVVRDTQPISASPRRFMRLRVTRAEGGVYTGFEPGFGYIVGTPVIGLDDPGVPGSAVWAKFAAASAASMTASAANPLLGTQALRIEKTDTASAAGLLLDLSGAGLDFSSPGSLTLRFSLAISSYSAGTGSQAQLYLGDSGVSPASGRYWTALVFNEGALYLYLSNPGGTANVAVSLGACATYADPGDHVLFEIAFDPAARTYGRVKVSGPKSSQDFTSALAGAALPWIPSGGAAPGKVLQIVVGGNDTILLDLDELSLGRDG